MFIAVIRDGLGLCLNGGPQCIERIGVAIVLLGEHKRAVRGTNGRTLAAILVEPSKERVINARRNLIGYGDSIGVGVFHRINPEIPILSKVSRRPIAPCSARQHKVVAEDPLLLHELGGKRAALVFAVVALGNQLGAAVAQLDVVVDSVFVGDLNVPAVDVHVPAVKFVAAIRRGDGALSGTFLLGNNALACGINRSTLIGAVRVVNALKRVAQLNGVVARHCDGGFRSAGIKRVLVAAVRHRLIVLEHGKLLASDALNGCAHGFVFDELASFVLEEVLHVDRTGGAVGNIVGVLGNKRQIAVALTIAISDIFENVVVREIKRVANSVDRAALVALDLPAEEDLILGSFGHAIGDDGSGVVNNVVGVGIGDLARAAIQIVLDAIGGLFAGDFYELELERVTVNMIIGVFDGVHAIAVVGDGGNGGRFPAAALPRKSSVLPVLHLDIFGTTSRGQVNYPVEHLFTVAVITIYMHAEVLVAILQAEAERRGIARLISSIRSKRFVQTALFEVCTVRRALEVDAVVRSRNDFAPTATAQVGICNLEVLLGARNLQLVCRLATLDARHPQRSNALTICIRVQRRSGGSALRACMRNIQVDAVNLQRVALPS